MVKLDLLTNLQFFELFEAQYHEPLIQALCIIELSQIRFMQLFSLERYYVCFVCFVFLKKKKWL